ncbi:MAG: ATP-binding protein [Thomasclavelia spiroformis]|uniref:ATP-binding protein n=1 Tax=Thomasclavelia spiroformis TaxID=29348 RepID=UPI003990A416
MTPKNIRISLSRWGQIFGDNVLANAILDRLIHHSHIINITGRLYRTKDKMSMIEDEDHTNQNW